jgi:hypothetical protein
MKIFGITLQVVALCVLFDVSCALPARHEVCSDQRFDEHENCGVFMAFHGNGQLGLFVSKAKQTLDDTYTKPDNFG